MPLAHFPFYCLPFWINPASPFLPLLFQTMNSPLLFVFLRLYQAALFSLPCTPLWEEILRAPLFFFTAMGTLFFQGGTGFLIAFPTDLIRPLSFLLLVQVLSPSRLPPRQIPLTPLKIVQHCPSTTTTPRFFPPTPPHSRAITPFRLFFDG